MYMIPAFIIEKVLIVKNTKYTRIVCSTYNKTGLFNTNIVWLVAPLLKTVRIKETRAIDAKRFSIAIKGISNKLLKKGMLLIPANSLYRKNSVYYCTSAHGGLEPGTYEVSHSDFPITGYVNEKKVEAYIGYKHGLIKIRSLREILIQLGSVFTVGSYSTHKQRYPLIPLAAGELTEKEEKRLWGLVKEDMAGNRLWNTILSFNGWLPNVRHIDIDESPAEDVCMTKRWILSKRFVTSFLKTVRETASVEGGIEKRKIMEELNIPEELLSDLIELYAEADVYQNGGYLFYRSGAGLPLSPMGRMLLEQLSNNNNGGIDLNTIKSQAEREQYKKFIRMGVVVAFEDGIIYHSDIYRDIRQNIFNEFNRKERITIEDVKRITGLSRKWIIPIMNRLTKEGSIRRYGASAYIQHKESHSK